MGQQAADAACAGAFHKPEKEGKQYSPAVARSVVVFVDPLSRIRGQKKKFLPSVVSVTQNNK